MGNFVKDHQLFSGFLGAIVGAVIIAAATLAGTSGGPSHQPATPSAGITSSSGNTIGTNSSPESSETTQLVNSYSGAGRNATLNATGRLTLANVTESSNGAITGQVIWSDGLRGSGPFNGTVKDNDILFTSTIASPQECEDRCTSIAYTGTVRVNGSLAGTYVAYQTSGKAQRGTWELAPSAPE
jgi:hypothetical protein